MFHYVAFGASDPQNRGEETPFLTAKAALIYLPVGKIQQQV